MNDCRLYIPNDIYEQIYVTFAKYNKNLPIKWLKDNLQFILNANVRNLFIRTNGESELIDKINIFPELDTMDVYTINNRYVITFNQMCPDENIPVPLFISHDTYKKMRRNYEIGYTHIEDHLQLYLPPGQNIITIVDRDNKRYLIQGRTDNMGTII
jgi:hypothetical protein